ncbi:MAG: gas vesicle protein GvpG [Candidatus Limnocylindria bacterium]
MLLKLLGLPVSLPAAGIRYCIEKVAEVAEAEMNSEEPIKDELLRLQIELEEGRLDEQAYVAQERVLLARLREFRDRQKQRLREEQEERADEEAASGRRVYIEMPDELQ